MFLFTSVEDPNNYLTYYKRGTVYLALGKAKSALSDFDKVIDLKPDFVAARVQRGNVYLKQADLEKAEQDLKEAVINCRCTSQENSIIYGNI